MDDTLALRSIVATFQDWRAIDLQLVPQLLKHLSPVSPISSEQQPCLVAFDDNPGGTVHFDWADVTRIPSTFDDNQGGTVHLDWT